MDNKIKLLVTQEKFDENFSIDEWINFSSLTNRELYNKMLLFVVNEKDEPVTIEQAREMFKKIKKSEWIPYLADFMKAIDEAYVNPTNGG